ncbi:MAG: hypothetical protein M1819_002358 [Sarea resinae]|nr:MAG: hypothetical protein M1819_002358 [Sarea resinae]
MEQTKALNALEPFVLLADSANSPRAATELITQATSAPNTYVFAELLEKRTIQALRTATPEQAAYLKLLEIFAWGTWADYTSNHTLPELNAAQAHKLRQLSLLTLALSPSTLTYTHLQRALGLPTARSLEDLVISAIYAGLLDAKLDTQAGAVEIASVAPLRDLPPHSVPGMVAVLADWDARCAGVLAEIEAQVAAVRRVAGERRKREKGLEALVERGVNAGGGGAGGGASAREGEAGGKSGKRAAAEEGGEERRGFFGGGSGGGGGVSGGGADGDDDEMDVEDGATAWGAGSGTRTAKRGGGRFGGGPGRRLG